MKTKFIAALLGCAAFFSYVAFKPAAKPKCTVAITQIAPHPSLDKIRHGIESSLKASGVRLLFQSAQGSVATARQIAQGFVSEKVDVIVPITTPSAQAAYRVAHLQKIPIIFAAVSDPIGAKLLSDEKIPGDGITGLFDFPPLEEQIRLIQAVFPSPTLRLGIIYNPSESNSVSIVNRIKHLAEMKKISIVEAHANTSAEVITATQSLLPQIDVIYVPNDNTVVSAIISVIKAADAAHKPVVCSDPESVEKGCVMSLSFDQTDLGYQVGAMVLNYLKDGRLPSPQKPTKTHLSVHETRLRHLGGVLPQVPDHSVR